MTNNTFSVKEAALLLQIATVPGKVNLDPFAEEARDTLDCLHAIKAKLEAIVRQGQPLASAAKRPAEEAPLPEAMPDPEPEPVKKRRR